MVDEIVLANLMAVLVWIDEIRSVSGVRVGCYSCNVELSLKESSFKQGWCRTIGVQLTMNFTSSFQSVRVGPASFLVAARYVVTTGIYDTDVEPPKVAR